MPFKVDVIRGYPIDPEQKSLAGGFVDFETPEIRLEMGEHKLMVSRQLRGMGVPMNLSLLTMDDIERFLSGDWKTVAVSEIARVSLCGSNWHPQRTEEHPMCVVANNLDVSFKSARVTLFGNNPVYHAIVTPIYDDKKAQKMIDEFASRKK